VNATEDRKTHYLHDFGALVGFHIAMQAPEQKQRLFEIAGTPSRVWPCKGRRGRVSGGAAQLGSL